MRLNEKHEPDGRCVVTGNEDGGMDMLNEREIKVQLEERIEDMAKILSKGKDVEIRTDPKTVVRVISVDKEVVKK